MDPERHFLTSEDHITRINPFDEAALEAALKIKDAMPEAMINLLTLGKIRVEPELRRCLALGADALYQIDTDSILDSYTKSRQLASVAGSLKPDLVLCGKESMDRQNGQVAAFMASHLEVPFVSAIVDLEYSVEKNRVVATRSGGRGRREKVRCRLPAVLSVDMGMFAYRVPRYEDLVRASAVPIQTAVGLCESIAPRISVMKTTVPLPRTLKTPVPDSDLPARQRIRQLLTGSKIEKKGKVLEGAPDVLVEGIISYLAEHGFVDTYGTD
jgi:electron transfer flavoprotein beta subunit